MIRVFAGTVAVLIAVELVGLGTRRQLALVLAGVVLGPLLAVLFSRIVPDLREPSSVAAAPPHWLSQWTARTEALIEYADGSGVDWDRRLRPVLAREFLAVSGCRREDRSGCTAAGRAMFGDALWRWVDPAGSAGRVDGPGRAALADILDRLAVPGS